MTEDADESAGHSPDETAPEDLPDGWTLWNDEPGGRRVLAYRPDEFDTQAFPPACLPTIYVAAGAPNRPPGEAEVGTPSVWRVQFFLEPEVEVTAARTYDDRERAIEGASDLAAEFAAGEIDFRDAYQVPRDDYLDRLDELTGRDS